MDNKAKKIRQALLAQEKPGVRFVRKNMDLILEQLEAGFSAAAIFRAFCEIGDAPPIKLRAFEYHLQKLKPKAKEIASRPTLPVQKNSNSLNWNATDTGKDIE